MSTCQIHQLVEACVEQVFPFGVFARLPDGTRAYVRKRELTQAGNLDPRQVVSVGDKLETVVIALAEADRELELSVRQAEPDPWETFAQTTELKDTVSAVVKKLSPRGIIVQVIPGVDSFIPLSELAPWPMDKPDDLFWIGDRVEAMVTYLERGARRVKLSIRQQMMHQSKVRQFMEFLEDRNEPEIQETVMEKDEPDEEKDGPIDSDVAERIGWVLVVDDHSEVRDPLVAWLHRLGLSAEGASSHDQALARLRKRRYGLALIDLNLSGKDGLDIIQALEEIAPETNAAVMSTPEWIARRIEELVTGGVIDYFVKPLDLDEIRETLIKLGRGEVLAPVWPTPSELDDKEKGSFPQLTEIMRSGTSLDKRFRAGLKELVHTSQAEHGIVFRLDPESQQVSIVTEVGQLALDSEAVYALIESPAKDLILEGGQVFETNVSDRAQRRFRNLLALLKFESCLGVPISARGQVQHALFLFHREANAFSHYRLRDVRAVAALFGVALESQALERRIQTVSPFLLSGQLAAGFGHEVYNKMSGLEIQLRNLQTDCAHLVQESESGSKIYLSSLDQSIGHLVNTALDLKETVELFRRLVQADREEKVDVNAVIQRVVQLLRLTAHQYQVDIEADLDLDLPRVIGSADRLQQAFANLMLNALQHTDKKVDQWENGRGVLRIVTAWEPEDTHSVKVRFVDTGPGIHYQLWENIFALGFSTRPGGTGLGLFIARSLTESMGGQIVVERSVIPIGTTFRVDLPEAE